MTLKLFVAAVVFFQFMAIYSQPTDGGQCVNHGQDISPSFKTCVNKNFSKYESELEMGLHNCNDYLLSGVSYEFKSCVNDNFKKIQQNVVFNRWVCKTKDFKKVDPHFVNCVNENFSSINESVQSHLLAKNN